MVRTLSFRVRPEKLPKLLEMYEQHVFPLVCALDEDAQSDDESIPMSMAIHWVPGLGDPFEAQ